MAQYYLRFVRQVWKNVAKLGRSQVVGAILAIGVLLAQLKFGVIERSLAAVNLWSILWPYGILLVAMVIWAMVQAPVQLDADSTRRRQEAEGRVDRVRSDADKQGRHYEEKIANLEQGLREKHPHDRHLERSITDGLSKLDEYERKFISLMLDSGTMTHGDVGRYIHGNPIDIARKMGVPRLFDYEQYAPGNGLVDLGGTYRVNPNMALALKNILYPPNDDLAHASNAP
jgi:hypothetical protein